MHNNTETLGQIIKKARKRYHLTIEALADKVGVPRDICIVSKMKAKSRALMCFIN